MKNVYLNSGTAVLERAPSYSPERQRNSAVRADTSETQDRLLPAGENLTELLGIDGPSALAPILRRALFNPVAELANNRGKRIRAQLVMLCHRLVAEESTVADLALVKQCRLAAEVVEMVHLGSLIVDDIEDGSRVRRGRPALHVQFGTPLALNAGNWLYFWPAELLRQMELPEKKRASAYERYNRTLLRAHFGQAADLGCRADHLAQAAVAPACLESMRLKSGALMGFAAALGALTANVDERVVTILDDFGRSLGVALQMFDDLGNVIGRCEPLKRFEDLLMKRLCWVWACAAQISTRHEYQQFVAAVTALPDEGALQNWIAEQDLIACVRRSARAHMDESLCQLGDALKTEGRGWSRAAFDELSRLGEEIANAYD